MDFERLCGSFPFIMRMICDGLSFADLRNLQRAFGVSRAGNHVRDELLPARNRQLARLWLEGEPTMGAEIGPAVGHAISRRNEELLAFPSKKEGDKKEEGEEDTRLHIYRADGCKTGSLEFRKHERDTDLVAAVRVHGRYYVANDGLGWYDRKSAKLLSLPEPKAGPGEEHVPDWPQWTGSGAYDLSMSSNGRWRLYLLQDEGPEWKLWFDSGDKYRFTGGRYKLSEAITPGEKYVVFFSHKLELRVYNVGGPGKVVLREDYADYYKHIPASRHSVLIQEDVLLISVGIASGSVHTFYDLAKRGILRRLESRDYQIYSHSECAGYLPLHYTYSEGFTLGVMTGGVPWPLEPLTDETLHGVVDGQMRSLQVPVGVAGHIDAISKVGDYILLVMVSKDVERGQELRKLRKLELLIFDISAYGSNQAPRRIEMSTGFHQCQLLSDTNLVRWSYSPHRDEENKTQIVRMKL